MQCAAWSHNFDGVIYTGLKLINGKDHTIDDLERRNPEPPAALLDAFDQWHYPSRTVTDTDTNETR
jgi:hypothetical protein